MSVVRIVFLGTPEFARHHLQALIDDEHFEVAGVVSQPDRPAGRKLKLTPSPVKQLALEHGIPVLTPEKINTAETLKAIAQWQAEAAVVVAFGQIVSQKFLDLYPEQVVNVHASLLPRWRGAAPIQRAIIAGDTKTGVALQVMVRKLDAGPVLGTRSTLITDEINALELHDQLMALGSELLTVEFMDYLRGNLSPEPQDESKVTYAPKLEKSEGQIDWAQEGRDIFNLVRGMSLGPGTYTLREGKVLKIHRVRFLEEFSGYEPSTVKPGQVVGVDEDSFTVACGRYYLRILEVQPASKARQKVAEYLKGYPLKIGDRLGE